ncbi:MAG: nucleotide exchange factor GrpE [Gammaproteobacteria bacterium]|nr:nucleotide exchange factor GrpE [Gammaproteobacteria bacterium]MDH3465008.1 nucleotide exchange factor GrpE [Gammaproteobacteria bacterium]
MSNENNAKETKVSDVDEVANATVQGDSGESPTAAAEEDASAADAEVSIETLMAELEYSRALAEEHKDQYLRAKAESENTRRRAITDVGNARKFAIEGFAMEMLAVRDSLDLARSIDLGEEHAPLVKKMLEGLDLTAKQIDSAFEKFGLLEVAPEPGDKFDPKQHQAMTAQETTEIEPNHIITVIQTGYMLNDRLLRPAMVIVSKVVPDADTAA